MKIDKQLTDTVSRLRKLLTRATPGDWMLDPEGPRYAINAVTRRGRHIAMVSCYERTFADRPENEANSALIPEMKNVLPALLDAYEELVRMQRRTNVQTILKESSMLHLRFNRTVIAFKKDITGSLAKWLVKLSPYTVPDNLEKIIVEFDKRITPMFAQLGRTTMISLDLSKLTNELYEIFQDIPEVMALNQRKNGREGYGLRSENSNRPDPDDDFIDILALAQNITCDFADSEDARAYWDEHATTEGAIWKQAQDCTKCPSEKPDGDGGCAGVCPDFKAADK